MKMPRRSLILAGGGLKVAYQAGVLQVWLDEAKIKFDHADGASGGVFNLAMYCQGLSGTEIADNWRNFPVLGSFSLNWRELLRLWSARSLLSYDRFRRVILAGRWNLDWKKINSGREGTFNAYDFTHQQLIVRDQREVDDDFLIAGVSLPGWFSPVKIGDAEFIDAVYVTDANLIGAIERGADELWIIWTVSEGGVWNGGFINTYFQIIEASADGNLARDLTRIQANNDAIARGERGEFGRPIKVEKIVGRVQLHYLINFRSDKFNAAVAQGIADAREWCRSRGYKFCPQQLQNAEVRIAESWFERSPPLPVAHAPIISDGGPFDPRVAPVAVHNEIDIAAPPERIWDFLVRAPNWPQWYPNSKNVRLDGGGDRLTRDAKFTWATFGVGLKSAVKEFIPNERLAWDARSIGVEAYHAWAIEPTGGGCRVKSEETQYGWLARTADWLLPNRMYTGHELWLKQLANECERRG
jgi:predicted acylesterase/phospholipase RssA/uncharacterized protein YndB with AHSA1/START domain